MSKALTISLKPNDIELDNDPAVESKCYPKYCIYSKTQLS